MQATSSGERQGAKFTVTLPVRAVREAAIEIQHPEYAADPAGLLGNTIRLDGLYIIIVDDEEETRDLLMAMLTQRGAEVKTCASAAEGLDAIERRQPSVLVSDIGMPVEDGYMLIRKLRELEPERGGNIPAVALTAYARSEDRTRALAAGFQIHIPKPVEAIEFITVVASLAGRRGMSA